MILSMNEAARYSVSPQLLMYQWQTRVWATSVKTLRLPLCYCVTCIPSIRAIEMNDLVRPGLQVRRVLYWKFCRLSLAGMLSWSYWLHMWIPQINDACMDDVATLYNIKSRCNSTFKAVRPFHAFEVWVSEFWLVPTSCM
jgi:hypothetical protein